MERPEKITMDDLKALADSISRLAQPGMRPTELIAAVRKEHPDARKKDVARAAFYAVILAAEHATERVSDLHRLAIETRNTQE
jgi:hypothetical protein